MKKLYIVLLLIVIVLSTSNIYLWLDNVQQWRIMNTQIQMLQRVLTIMNHNRVYEDEILEDKSHSGENI